MNLINVMRNFKIGDLVIGKTTWYGRSSYLDYRFCNEPGVVTAVDPQSLRFYYVSFSFGTYLLQESDLILISQNGEDPKPKNN